MRMLLTAYAEDALVMRMFLLFVYSYGSNFYKESTPH